MQMDEPKNCRMCSLPEHPHLNCGAVQERLMEIAKTAKDSDPVPYEAVCKSGVMAANFL
jgi:hypothetical protein